MKRDKKAQSSSNQAPQSKPNALKRNFSDRTESSQPVEEQTLKRSKNDSNVTANTQGSKIQTVKASTEKGFTGPSNQWFDSKFVGIYYRCRSGVWQKNRHRFVQEKPRLLFWLVLKFLHSRRNVERHSAYKSILTRNWRKSWRLQRQDSPGHWMRYWNFVNFRSKGRSKACLRYWKRRDRSFCRGNNQT